MSTIVTRAGKGSPLTNTELDSNFTNLNTDKLELSGGSLTGNLSLGQNNKAIFNSQLEVYGDGSNSHIKDTSSGNLNISGNDIQILNAASNEAMAYFAQDGDVTLYHNGSPKIATTSTGIDVTGVITTDGMTTSADINFGDDDKALFGAGNDLKIYHSANNQSYIHEVGSGDLNILATNLKLQDAGGSTKVLVNSTGIDVTGSVVADGLTVNGDITLSGDKDIHLTATNPNSGSAFQYGEITFGDSTTGQFANHAKIISKGGYAADTTLEFHTSSNNSSPLNMKLDQSGNLNLINGSLMVGSTTAPSSYYAFANNLVVTGDSANRAGMTISGTATSMINLSDGTGLVGFIDYNHSNDSMTLGTAASNALVIDFQQNATFSNSLEVNNHRYFDSDYNVTYYRKANHTTLGYQLHRDNGKSYYEWNTGGTHSYDFQFVSNNSPVLSLATNGNVNIPNGSLMVGSTTAPTDKLEIRGNAKIEQTSNVDAILRLNPNSGTIGSNYRWELVGGNSAASYGFQIREGTTPYLTINNSAGGNAGNATFSGSVTSTGNTTIKDAGVVRLKAAPSGSLYGGGFDVFSVTGSNTSPYTSTTRFGNYGQNEVMVLTGANVNIPNGSLMVGATTAPSAPLQVSAAPSNTVGAVGISLKDSGNAIEFGLRLDATSKDLHLDRYYSGGWLETMSWDRSTGNVGIGCSPSSTLHIKTSVDNSVSQGLIIERSANTDRGYINYQGGAFRMVATDGDPIRFGHVSNSNEVSIHTDGSLLVGKTATTFSVQGTVLNANGTIDSTRSGDAPLYLNRLANDGSIIALYKDTVSVGAVSTWGGELAVGRLNCALLFDDDNNHITPHSVNSDLNRDAAIDLGDTTSRFKDLYLSGTANVQYAGATDTGIYFNGSFNAVVPYRPDTGVAVDDYLDLGVYSHRWDDIFATNGTIQTSDRNEKQDIESLTEAEERVAIAAKSLLKKFRWKSAVEDKGDDARIHFGIIAQDLQAAFEAEGLDAGRYGMFTSNTWTNEDGEEQTRMGVRYSELLAFIISAI